MATKPSELRDHICGSFLNQFENIPRSELIQLTYESHSEKYTFALCDTVPVSLLGELIFQAKSHIKFSSEREK